MSCKCIFSKKNPVLKGYVKCQIKGSVMIDHCYKEDGIHCPHFKMSLLDKLDKIINYGAERL